MKNLFLVLLCVLFFLPAAKGQGGTNFNKKIDLNVPKLNMSNARLLPALLIKPLRIPFERIPGTLYLIGDHVPKEDVSLKVKDTLYNINRLSKRNNPIPIGL